MLNNIHIYLEEKLHTKPNPMNMTNLKLIFNQYNIAFLIQKALDFKRQIILEFILLCCYLLTFLTSYIRNKTNKINLPTL